jgi:riboflavin kinase/FMN adenylyltransferase
LGNFDGVHLGHAHLIRSMQVHAIDAELVPSVGFFHPHPHDVFHRPWSMLTPLRLKLSYLADLGVKQVVIFRFDEQMAQWTPNSFMRILFESCHARSLVVGEDFRFGAKRSGGIETLQHYPGAVLVPGQFDLRGERVSSSVCRKALALGDFIKLTHFLGRPYAWIGRFDGEVAHPLHPAQAMPPEGMYQVSELAAPVCVKAGKIHFSQEKFMGRFLTLTGWSKL